MRICVAILLTLSLPAGALAQIRHDQVSYSYLEFSGVVGKVDASPDDIDARGMALDLSAEFSEHIHGYILHYDVSDDEPGFSADSELWSLGVGTQFEIIERLSLYGRLGALDADIEATVPGIFSITGSDDGYYIAGGIRAIVSDRLQLGAAIEHYDLEDSGSDEYLSFGGDYLVTEVVAFSFEANVHDDATALVLGVRFYPGNDRLARRR